MIDGLKLTMTGIELRRNIDDRIRWHQKELHRISQQLDGAERPPTPQSMRDRVLQSDVAEAERRIAALTFIREYLVNDEIYRLGEFDLRFADLLPDDSPFACDCVGRSAVGDEHMAVGDEHVAATVARGPV